MKLYALIDLTKETGFRPFGVLDPYFVGYNPVTQKWFYFNLSNFKIEHLELLPCSETLFTENIKNGNWVEVDFHLKSHKKA